VKFSILKEEITPHIPVLQGGFSGRNHKSLGVHDSPYLSVVIIKSNKTVVIIALDLLYGDRSFASGIKKAIKKKFGFEKEDILINYSHTHSVVGVTGEDPSLRPARLHSINADKVLWDLDVNEIDFTEDIEYFKLIRNKIINMIDKGLQNLIEGQAFIYKGFSRFGVSRRYPHEKRVLWKPYFNDEAIDTDLFLIKFIDKKNILRGLIYNYACHPTTLGSDNYLISADFPGVVNKYLERKNPGMKAVFLQGCGADIKPYITAKDGSFKSCDFDELEIAGKVLFNEIQKLIENDDERKNQREKEFQWRKIEFDIKTNSIEVKLHTNPWDASKWEAILNSQGEPEYVKDSARRILMGLKENKSKKYLSYQIALLRLDDKTSILALECEVVSDIGKSIKRALLDEHVIALGYCNSSVCYIPTRKILNEGGYEALSFIKARLAGPFLPEIEDIIVDKATSLLLEKN